MDRCEEGIQALGMFSFSTKFSFPPATFPASFCGSSTADASSLSQGVMADQDGQAFVEEGSTNFNSGEDEIDQNRDLPSISLSGAQESEKGFFSSGGQTPCKQFAGGTGAHQILVVLLEVCVWTTQPVGLYGKNSSSLDRDIKTEKTRWQRTLTGTRCVLLSTKFQVEASDLLSEEKCCDPVRL